MLDPLEIPILDRNSEWQGVATEKLMENAGKALAEVLTERYPKARTILFVCGSGNNGGDGFVAARYLAERGLKIEVLLLRPPERIGTELARNAFLSLGPGVSVEVLGRDIGIDELGKLMEGYDIIVDGMLGSGAKGPPRGNYAKISGILRPPRKVVSIDMPTGLGNQPSVKAELTVTFHDIKNGMMESGKPHLDCGEIVIRDIGIPREAATHVGPGDLLRYPTLDGPSKKGDGGKVLVIGGGPYTGAPFLAAMGALRAGADLVRVAVPWGIADVVSGYSPDIIVEAIGTGDQRMLGAGDIHDLIPLMDWADAILVGPGAGTDEDTVSLVLEVIRRGRSQGKGMVVDADGISAVSSSWDWSTPLGGGDSPLVLTPHRGELMKLLSSVLPKADRGFLGDPYIDLGRRSGRWNEEVIGPLTEFVERTNVTLLVKGAIDLILSPGNHSLGEGIRLDPDHDIIRRYNTTGNPAMTVGGTGDVLSGLCTGLLARGMPGFDTACLAAFVNGKAGDCAFQDLGHSMMATDLLEHIRIKTP